MWRRMEETYLPWLDYGDLPYVSSGGRWQSQQHIYQSPFYYIDYVLAATCALQFWIRAEDNPQQALKDYVTRAADVSPEHPVLVDKFLIDATEVDVDAVSDGERVVIAAIMEHIEAAGLHSGDSACVIPARTLSDKVLDTIREQIHKLALALKVRGLMNVQFAVKDETVYVLEVNPRASRTVPYVSKAVGVPIAQIAARVAAFDGSDLLGRTFGDDMTGLDDIPSVGEFESLSGILLNE